MYKYLSKNKYATIFLFTLFFINVSKADGCQYCEQEKEPTYHHAPEAIGPQTACEQQQCLPPSLPCTPYGGFCYVKLGGMLDTDKGGLNPCIGIGRRFEWGDTGVDLSMNFGGPMSSYYFCPKILALRYLDPYAASSLYLGAGLSWGGISSHSRHFDGLFFECALGYEFQRNSPIRTFVQLDISQGILSAGKSGDLPPPVLALTAGIGF